MNGRRAWRKRRRKLGCLASAEWLRRHQGRVELWDYGTPGKVPPRPWSARSLVGMTMGARKRKALRARNAVLALLAGKEADPAKLLLLRSIYRIGQRLNPCPECERCADKCTGCEGDEFEGAICERCGRTATGAVICDGSRVIPARKAKR